MPGVPTAKYPKQLILYPNSAVGNLTPLGTAVLGHLAVAAAVRLQLIVASAFGAMSTCTEVPGSSVRSSPSSCSGVGFSVTKL